MGAESSMVHSLEGLDGQNPLGFFAALGLLRVLDDAARSAGTATPMLSFRTSGRAVAQLVTERTIEQVVETVIQDARGDAGRVALGLVYDEEGKRCLPDAATATFDLKPSAATAKQHLVLARAKDDARRSADLALAFFSELVQDGKNNTKPTSFHFAAGQQQWLDMVNTLRQGLTADLVDEALRGPWQERAAPSLAWDSSVSRNYALRATDPSKEKRGSIPGANWLAVIGLTFFPVIPRGGKLQTARVVGGWKDSEFIWPLWSGPAPRSVVASLLRGDPRELTPVQRSLLGVSQVLSCSILRSDQGGYGSFTPADVRPWKPRVDDRGRSRSGEGREAKR